MLQTNGKQSAIQEARRELGCGKNKILKHCRKSPLLNELSDEYSSHRWHSQLIHGGAKHTALGYSQEYSYVHLWNIDL